MSKLTDHLGKHLRGDALDKKSIIRHFSTDCGIFRVTPRAVVYPKDVTDIRKVSRFCWQLAERGKSLPLTVRGKGTDQGGAAIGEGLVMALPAYMNRLLDIDRESVTVEPGMIYGDLQRTLRSHGRFIPSYPASLEFSTVGGAVANNSSGEKSFKYGSTADYVQELEVVLANGQVIRIRPLSKRELNKKKGQTDLEGEIYRQIDGLLLDNEELIEQARPQIGNTTAGYALWDVRRPDGTFDLTRLIAGSQGTLGTVSEIVFKTQNYNPETDLLTVSFDDVEKAAVAIDQLQRLKPSAMELVDHHLLSLLKQNQPEQVSQVLEGELPKLLLLVEFDDEKPSARKRKVKKSKKILRELATEFKTITDPEEQENVWKIRRGSTAAIWMEKGKKKALPIIEDGIVPLSKLPEFLQKIYHLFNKHNLEVAVWGHAGNANFHVQPLLDLNDASDRQTVFKLMDEYYETVFGMGGSTCGEHNDSRLRGPYLTDLYGEDMYKLFQQVKKVFDPHSILNPGVKVNVSKDVIRKQLRSEYDLTHLYDHIPHAQH